MMAKKKLREGFTTGTSATAALKAAALALRGEFPKTVTVESPQHRALTLPIEKSEVIEGIGSATVIKDAGDDMDVTHGTLIVVSLEVTTTPGITFIAGTGVGTVTRPGLQVKVGDAAINPGPRWMMKRVYEELADEGTGWKVTVSVPAGEALAKKTLNPVLGVMGGISIIGTSGIVKPMSEEAYKKSLIPQFTVLRAAHQHWCVMTPGRIGYDAARKIYDLPVTDLVETSNFIGFMLEEAVDKDIREIILIGHLGKLIKVASGSFHTHNRMSDGRMETLAAYAALNGADAATVKEILTCSTTDGAAEIIRANNLEAIYPQLAERAQVRAQRFVHEEAKVGVIFVTMQGEILAQSSFAKEFMEAKPWLRNS
ncbi:MAG: cobalt-precorrin-5B (C(1))-methyltransferase CbiD [Negativicoccus succinicivorans]|nr:cobalt-precorrin-5B (C(1))-methyltransferase CbiD [Negativicoccus succinicivorans]MDU2929862.1 cobalt-precorrin-5B (C(1))-methyltransferase CbiD [Negativicoccus succinicivorans]